MTFPTHPTAWEIWREQFTDGEEIVVLDEHERLWRGTHEATETHLIVNPGRIREARIRWVDVAFVAHDGFPARKLMGADGSHAAELIDTESTTSALRQFFRLANDPELKRPRRVRVAFSDPWWIDGAEGVLHFPGNDGPEHWVQDEEEVLVLRACDGARAVLWSMDSVFHLEEG